MARRQRYSWVTAKGAQKVAAIPLKDLVCCHTNIQVSRLNMLQYCLIIAPRDKARKTLRETGFLCKNSLHYSVADLG